MVTTLYILVNCTMQQSVNGNNKHKVKLVTTRGGWYWWWWGWRIFLLATNQRGCIHGHFSGWLRADPMRGPLLHQLSFFFFSFLKMLKWFHWQMTKRKVSVRIHSSCLVWQVPKGERRTHPWKIMKQLSNAGLMFHFIGTDWHQPRSGTIAAWSLPSEKNHVNSVGVGEQRLHCISFGTQKRNMNPATPSVLCMSVFFAVWASNCTSSLHSISGWHRRESDCQSVSQLVVRCGKWTVCVVWRGRVGLTMLKSPDLATVAWRGLLHLAKLEEEISWSRCCKKTNKNKQNKCFFF